MGDSSRLKEDGEVQNHGNHKPTFWRQGTCCGRTLPCQVDHHSLKRLLYGIDAKYPSIQKASNFDHSATISQLPENPWRSWGREGCSSETCRARTSSRVKGSTPGRGRLSRGIGPVNSQSPLSQKSIEAHPHLSLRSPEDGNSNILQHLWSHCVHHRRYIL